MKDHIRAVRESFCVSRPDPYILLAHLYGGTSQSSICTSTTAMASVVQMETGESRESTGISHRRPWNDGRD